MNKEHISVVGIDVGGSKKGFHAVALRNGSFMSRHSSSSASSIVTWIEKVDAWAIGIDAPCKWSKTGRARRAERDLMRIGIWCFSTPTQAIAEAHRCNHFGWMLNGMLLYNLLSNRYQLFSGTFVQEEKVMFETFPQAIACMLAGKIASAKNKGPVRRELLARCGIDTSHFENIDYVDAALCALAASRLIEGRVQMFGEIDTGLIVVPLPLFGGSISRVIG
jgi:predicted nuclease with RNAse H fold